MGSARRWVCVALFGLSVSGFGCAELGNFDLSQIIPFTGALDEATVADGLKQALEIGTDRAARTVGVPGGFSGNPAIRLGLPQQLDGVANTLRTFGLGAQLDGLVTTMNEAAEMAAGEAVPVFAKAISNMTVSDAFEILNGPDDAATVYFQKHTTGELRERFTPVVDNAMTSVGLYTEYRDLVGRYEALPFVKPAAPDLAGYVTSQTLDGLFTVLAEEEAQIRKDPAARTTALLRRVFGQPSNAGEAPRHAE